MNIHEVFTSRCTRDLTVNLSIYMPLYMLEQGYADVHTRLSLRCSNVIGNNFFYETAHFFSLAKH